MTDSSGLVIAAALLVGCVVLYYGAHWLVRGAVTLATALGISKTVIGLTLVAVGTSAPEIFVNVIAGSRGETGIALANVSGSNLTNLCIGFGICALVAGVVIDWRSFRTDCRMAVISTALILVVLFLNGDAGLPFWTLAPLLALLLAYLVSLRRRASEGVEEEESGVTTGQLILHGGLFLMGVAALYGGGRILLEAAIETADRVGMPSSLVGLTIVAAGTSIPDTIASLVAARQGEYGIAVGNLLGSNISNVVVVLSATLLASQTSLDTGGDTFLTLDYLLVTLVSLLFLFMAARFGKISRNGGVLLLVIYFSYMGFRIYVSL